MEYMFTRRCIRGHTYGCCGPQTARLTKPHERLQSLSRGGQPVPYWLSRWCGGTSWQHMRGFHPSPHIKIRRSQADRTCMVRREEYIGVGRLALRELGRSKMARDMHSIRLQHLFSSSCTSFSPGSLSGNTPWKSDLTVNLNLSCASVTSLSVGEKSPSRRREVDGSRPIQN